jgi:rubrerythrin
MTEEERTIELELFYKYTYICNKCNLRYGTDKEEKKEHLCPLCEGRKIK